MAMTPNDPQTTAQRETVLSVALSVLIGGFLLVFFVIITGGLVLYLFLVGAGMSGFAALHYLWWGRTLSEQVEGEREEQELREQARADDWPVPEPRHRG
jgi:hypothetical protein